MLGINHCIISADDFGISPGVNHAIIEAHNNGFLTHTSLFACGDYTEEAVQLALPHTGKLHIGLHINLSIGKSVLGYDRIPLLVTEEGSFKYGFASLLLKCSSGSNALRQQIHDEIEAQIIRLQQLGVTISHMDGHRHIHMIPVIWNIVTELAAKYHIPRIRHINENIIHTTCNTRNVTFLLNGGIIKYLLLRALALINGSNSSVYFFSILHSCQISAKMLESLTLPKGYDAIEIMLHPGNTEMDKLLRPDHPERAHILSPNRDMEFKAALLC
jgi:chitin disaccharide deacetylase